MKNITSPRSRDFLIMLAITAVFAISSTAHAADSIFQVTGNNTALDGKVEQAGTWFLNILRIIMFVLIGVGFVKFVTSKKYVDLIWLAGGVLGFAYSRTIAEFLFAGGK